MGRGGAGRSGEGQGRDGQGWAGWDGAERGEARRDGTGRGGAGRGENRHLWETRQLLVLYGVFQAEALNPNRSKYARKITHLSCIKWDCILKAKVKGMAKVQKQMK